MICRRCTTRILSLLPPPTTTTSTTIPLRQTRLLTSTPPGTPLPNDPPAATSTSAAQPFSTPLTPSPAPSHPPSNKPHKKSSLPEGSPLRGLDYLKSANPPLARADADYPSWLWTLLDAPSSSSSGARAGEAAADAGDLYAKSQKQRKAARKAGEREKKLVGRERMGVHHVVVPVEERSGDLGGEGLEGEREELRAGLRRARRQGIKERNFLRGMRR